MKKQATWAVFVAALLVGAPAHAMVVDMDGKLIPRERDTRPPVVIGEAHAGACKAPPKNRPVAFNLAPGTKLVDAVAWISSITCKPFVVPAWIVDKDKRLTMVAPARITPKDAYRLFLGGLDLIGFTVDRVGKFLRIIGNTLVFMRGAEPEPYVAALVRLRDFPPLVRQRLLAQYAGHEHFVSNTIVITDVRSIVERLLGRPVPIGR